MEKEIDMRQTGSRISELISRTGCDRRTFAGRLNISESTLKNYLYGRSMPPYDRMREMSKLFGLKDIEEMIVRVGGTDDEE